MRGCFARWLSGERGEKRAVKHGKSGLRTAICALSGTLRGDLCKTVEKLCKSLQGVKTKITNCAQRFVRLCVLVRELCKYRFLSAFGVWALRCGGAPFGRFPSRLRRRGAHLGGGGGAVGGESAGCCARGLPPLPSPSPTLRSALRPSAGKVHGRRQAHAGRTHGTSPISGRGLGLRRADAGRTHGTSPISGRRHGRRQAVAGRTHGQERGLPCALPPLRSALRPSAGRGTAVGELKRGERTGRSGVCLVHFRLCARHFAHKLTEAGGRRAGAGHCARGRPPLPSPSPTLRSAARATWPQRRGLFPTAARTLPGAADGRTIYYIYACAGARARTFCTGRRATMWITFPWITHCG